MDQRPDCNGRPRPPEAPADSRARPRKIDSRSLLGARGQLVIAHGDETYLLRETRNGKLILTK